MNNTPNCHLQRSAGSWQASLKPVISRLAEIAWPKSMEEHKPEHLESGTSEIVPTVTYIHTHSYIYIYTYIYIYLWTYWIVQTTNHKMLNFPLLSLLSCCHVFLQIETACVISSKFQYERMKPCRLILGKGLHSRLITSQQ